MHETLYHFHEPKDEGEANAWLMNFLLRYNGMQHRSELHSRIEDWLENLPCFRCTSRMQLGTLLHLCARTRTAQGRR